MMYGDSLKAGQNLLSQPKLPAYALEGDYEFSKEYLDPKNWKFSSNNNTGLIMLFMEKLCKYSEEVIGTGDIEGTILAIKGDKEGIEDLKRAYSMIEEMCNDLNKGLEKDLIKGKLYFFKVWL